MQKKKKKGVATHQHHHHIESSVRGESVHFQSCMHSTFQRLWNIRHHHICVSRGEIFSLFQLKYDQHDFHAANAYQMGYKRKRSRQVEYAESTLNRNIFAKFVLQNNGSEKNAERAEEREREKDGIKLNEDKKRH